MKKRPYRVRFNLAPGQFHIRLFMNKQKPLTDDELVNPPKTTLRIEQEVYAFAAHLLNQHYLLFRKNPDHLLHTYHDVEPHKTWQSEPTVTDTTYRRVWFHADENFRLKITFMVKTGQIRSYSFYQNDCIK